jgi:hypothetical protein
MKDVAQVPREAEIERDVGTTMASNKEMDAAKKRCARSPGPLLAQILEQLCHTAVLQRLPGLCKCWNSCAAPAVPCVLSSLAASRVTGSHRVHKRGCRPCGSTQPAQSGAELGVALSRTLAAYSPRSWP